MNSSPHMLERNFTTDPERVLDLKALRADFPALHQQVRGHPLVYLDNGATSQKPQSVIDTIRHYYERDNSNVHRGVHTLSERATLAYEGVRKKVRNFFNAASIREIIFVRGTTEAINLVAQSYGRPRFSAGDEILITEMEHHSNIVPWQLLCQQTGATLKVVPFNDAGELDVDAYHQLLGPKTRLVAVVHVSNSLGTVNPVAEMIKAAHQFDVPVLVDGAQAVAHRKVDVQALDCDFYTCSAHKLFGPTGTGVLYAKEALLADMEPYQGGGDMISRVSFEKTLYNDLPYKFEAGTPNIAGVIGLGAALDYLDELDMAAIAAHEDELLDYATTQLQSLPGVRLIGTATEKASILSFCIEGVHPHDISTILDGEGIAIRAGHHCTMPVMTHYGLSATARASFALYNNRADVDALIAGIDKVKEIFQS